MPSRDISILDDETEQKTEKRDVVRTDEDKFDGRNLGFELAERRVELRAARKFPQAIEDGGHGVFERRARSLVERHEPLFEFGGGGDALCSRESRATVHELRGVQERAAAGVVECDLVHEPAVDRQVRLFEVRDVVRPGRRDRLELFGRRQAHA